MASFHDQIKAVIKKPRGPGCVIQGDDKTTQVTMGIRSQAIIRILIANQLLYRAQVGEKRGLSDFPGVYLSGAFSQLVFGCGVTFSGL